MTRQSINCQVSNFCCALLNGNGKTIRFLIKTSQKMGNADTKLNFRKAVVQLTSKSQVNCLSF